MLSKRRNEVISARHLTPKQMSHEIHQTNPATCPNRGYGQHPLLSNSTARNAALASGVNLQRRCLTEVQPSCTQSVGVVADQSWLRRTAGNLQSDAKVYAGEDEARTSACATYAADVWFRFQVTYQKQLNRQYIIPIKYLLHFSLMHF
jgi:hypothetical protein